MVTLMVFTSDTVELIVKVVCPLAPVLAGVEMVLPVPVELAVTVAPEIKLLLASLAVTVTVETDEPSAETVVGLAVAVELAALAIVLATKPTVGWAVMGVPAMVIVLVLVSATVERMV